MVNKPASYSGASRLKLFAFSLVPRLLKAKEKRGEKKKEKEKTYRLPHFLSTNSQMAVRLSGLHAGSLLPLRNISGTHFS
jgi:hypothetical protein